MKVFDESSPLQMGKTARMKQIVEKLRAAGLKVVIWSSKGGPNFPGDKRK